MKRATRTHITYSESGVKLSATERQALRRAAEIADRLREECRAIRPDFEDDPMDTLIAEVEHNARELADLGFIPVVENESGLIP